MPCLAHVMNIAVQAMLGKDGINAPAMKDSVIMHLNDVEDDAISRTGLIQEEEEQESQDDDPSSEQFPSRNAVAKLRKGIVKIRYALLISADRVVFN